MVCQHLEQLAMDIESQEFPEIYRDQQESASGVQWNYFDCYLDRKSIRQKWDFPDFIKDHIDQNMDGTPEEGLMCEKCNCGIIGLQKGYMPGNKVFGYNNIGQIHVFSFKDNHFVEETPTDIIRQKPTQTAKRWPGLPSIIFAVLLGVPVALYQYFPHHMILGFVAGICTLMVVPLILSPIMQIIRGKGRYSFPFASIFIVLLIGTPVFILYGWDAIYYMLAAYAGISFFGSIFLRLVRKKTK